MPSITLVLLSTLRRDRLGVTCPRFDASYNFVPVGKPVFGVTFLSRLGVNLSFFAICYSRFEALSFWHR